jgi:REP element-mobilizing transposase RayT
LEPDDRTLALNAIRFWDGRKWHVYAAVVMPDHVHALVRPLPLDVTDPAAAEFHNLSELTRGVKGYSSYRINRRQGRAGTFWQDESYDHIIRDDQEFEETWAYIIYNPVKAGLVETPEAYLWLYQAGRAD